VALAAAATQSARSKSSAGSKKNSSKSKAKPKRSRAEDSDDSDNELPVQQATAKPLTKKAKREARPSYTASAEDLEAPDEVDDFDPKQW
jgi:hypothetical protein